MYKLPYFSEQDEVAVKAFMNAYPFVMLIGCNANTSVATQVPVLIRDENGNLYISCHIMRNTDHYKVIADNPDVLILFQGPHCYVSSSWCTEKMGATWNYQTVHVRGRCRMMSDEETITLLTYLTARFEADQKEPLLAADLPQDYMLSHVKAIAGLEITVTDIYPIFKLSQNRDDESYKNIVRHLLSSADTDSHKVAREMMTRRPQLF